MVMFGIKIYVFKGADFKYVLVFCVTVNLLLHIQFIYR